MLYGGKSGIITAVISPMSDGMSRSAASSAISNASPESDPFANASLKVLILLSEQLPNVSHMLVLMASL